jgi:hypothetical protein
MHGTYNKKLIVMSTRFHYGTLSQPNPNYSTVLKSILMDPKFYHSAYNSEALTLSYENLGGFVTFLLRATGSAFSLKM